MSTLPRDPANAELRAELDRQVDPVAASMTNAQLFERGSRVIPGGVNSPVRAFRSVGGVPIFAASASGAFVTDVEGRTYLDMIQSYGASILGHADNTVLARIGEAASRGTTYGMPTAGEVRLAEMIVERYPPVESVRLVSSGTEAVMSALRVARAATARDVIVKFDGNYHGHSDAMLASAGSGAALFGEPGSPGVTSGAIADTSVEPYNVVPHLDDRVAAVIVEPVAANMGLVAPADGFLQGLRQECDRVGALLIFDEVITGFRLGPGGAAARFGVTPDLACFGKVIGGGLPVGAFGGRRDLMALLAPAGPVYQAGTLSGNPLATAAGACVLQELDDRDGYTGIDAVAAALADGLAAVFAEVGLVAEVPRIGPLVGLFFGSGLPANFEEAKASVALGLYPHFFHGMLNRGIALAPGPYEVMFPSLAHQGHVDTYLQAAREVARDIVDDPGGPSQTMANQ